MKPVMALGVQRLAGWYDNPTPEPPSTSSQGLRIGPQDFNYGSEPLLRLQTLTFSEFFELKH
jgi:hypothetical protein